MSVIMWGIWSVWSWGRPKKTPFFLFWNSLWYDACYDIWVRSQLFTSTTRGGLEASGSQSGFFVDFFFENLGANASMPFRPKMSRWTLTCSPWVRRHVAIVWRAVCSRKRRWNGHPPKQGHLDAADFSADFLRIFCVTLEYLFSSAKTSKKNLRPNKSAQ